MPARDLFHDSVRESLEKDGWEITNDPYYVEIGDTSFHVDLGAEKLIAAKKGMEKIAVEIKGFFGPSLTSEFHTALGQFLNYSLAIQHKEPERKLYLAIPENVYVEFFQSTFVKMAISHYGISLVVFNPDSNEIVKMGKVEKYQNIIVELLKKHAAYKPVNIEDAERQVIADTVRNHFQLVTIGWEKQRFVHNCSFHFDIKGEKIWIQQNWTDIDIAKELEEMGVPKSDIVLGFQPPKYRSFTGYAEA